MSGIDTRVAKGAWTVLLMALGLWLIYQARAPILIFVLALFLAYMLSPVITFLTRVTPKRVSRTWALAAVYIVLIVSIGSALFVVISRIATEASSLAAKLPEFARNNSNALEWPLPSWLEPWKPKLIELAQAQIKTTSDEALPMLRQAGSGLLSGLGNLGFSLLIPILSFFFLMDGVAMRRDVLDGVESTATRLRLEAVLDDIHVLLGQYIRALLILSTATFIFYDIFFGVASVPYGGLLALLAALLEFIPVVGPLTAGVIAIAVAGFSGYTHLGWMAGFFIFYRLFQDYVLQPYLLGSGVALHPLLILFGALAGEQVGGVFGMFLSVPVLATLRIVYIHAKKAANEA